MKLIIREIPIKAIIVYHLTPIRIITIKKTKYKWWGCENLELLRTTLLAKMQNVIASMENGIEVPQKSKNGIYHIIHSPTSGYLSKRIEIRIVKRY